MDRANVTETEEMKGQRMAIIEEFSVIIKDQRKQAIDARRGSGIEQDWQEDEDHYNGVDKVNRGTPSQQKGRTPSDGISDGVAETTTRSTVFLKITRPYVDAASARVSDMLLPTDDRNYAIRPTPKPALVRSAIEQPVQPAMQPAQEMPQQPGGLRAMMGKFFGSGQPQQPMAQHGPAVDPIEQAKAKAKAAAESAQTEIDDWLVECRYHAEVRKVIEGTAKVGTGILKGPHAVMRRKRAAKQVNGVWAVEMVEKIAPESKYINHWNFYPDGSCGNDIQKGSYVFECEDITYRRLTDLKKDPSYITEMIDLCIDEGPISAIDGTRKLKEGEKAGENDLFQIWYYHGMVSKKNMEAAGCYCDGKELYPAIAMMVNDRIIKVTLSALDSGEFPYDVMTWQARPDCWAGVGVSRQMRECQKGANAAVRNLMDNAGLSAGPQIIIDRSKIIPANKRWELTPRKIWYTVKDEEVGDVNQAFAIVGIETRQQELMAILMFWLKEAEDVTGLPMLLQGQQGSAPDTLGGTQIMNNNGSTVLRRIARTFDDKVTEPHIGRYYEYLLMYGSDESKGDFTIDARGSSALVDRDAQSKELMQMLGLSLNPAYGRDPELVMNELLKSLRIDPKSTALSDEKKQEMAQRKPPEDPRVTAAKIRAQVDGQSIQASAQNKKMELDHAASESAQDRHLKQWIAQTDAQLAAANLTSDERRHLEDVKATLTGITLKLKTQTDLTMGGHAVDLHKNRMSQVITPAFEPPGRAAPGKAFTQ